MFFLNAEFNTSSYTKDNGYCSFFQTFKFSQDIFAAVFTIIISLYLNITFNYFSSIFDTMRIHQEQICVKK